MCAAFVYRYNVVNLINGNESAFLKAQFAKRMCPGVLIADTFPSSAVLTVGIGAAFVLVVAIAFLLLVLLTAAVLGQPGASRIGTGTLWLSGHLRPPFMA